jgi:hypothetical protein
MAEIINMRGEVLPPGKKAQGNENISDEQLDTLARVLDDVFQIPGTNIRFGLDAIIGVIPGIGDMITGATGMLMVYTAWNRGLPKVTMARMVANIAVDSLLGSMPIVGDIFDVAWKANRRNYELLTRAREIGGPTTKHTLQDWLFLVLLILAIAGLVAIPLAVLYFLIYKVRQG